MPDGDPDGPGVTWRILWRQAEESIGDRTVARWLCEHASGCDRAEFDAELDAPATNRQVAHLDAMTSRVREGEPVQYVMGRWAFRRLDVMVDPRVLIPRPETESIVEHVMSFLSRRGRTATSTVADLGTGSGVIGLSLLAESPLDSIVVWMTDESSGAIDVARANAAGIGRRAVNARFAVGDWCDALPDELRGCLDAIVSNPPYIALDDPEVEPVVVAHEPHGALFAGTDGLDDVRAIVGQATQWLAPGGGLFLEIGHRQASAVADLFASAGLHDVTVHRDLAGRDRFVVGVV